MPLAVIVQATSPSTGAASKAQVLRVLPSRAVRFSPRGSRRAILAAMVPLVERTLALRQETMTHGVVSISRPGPSSWGEKGCDDPHPAFMAPGKVGVCGV
jgi:hypothetical protein